MTDAANTENRSIEIPDFAMWLTEKQRSFSQEYIVDLDPSSAYVRAGYKPKSTEAARSAAIKLLSDATVERYVVHLQKTRSAQPSVETNDTADSVLEFAISLSDKQLSFAQEYIVDLDPPSAYIRAGYKPKSIEAARSAASRLLNDQTVGRYVVYLQRARSVRTGITADNVIMEIAKIAFSNISDYFIWDKDGIKLKDSSEFESDKNKTSVISEITQEEFGRGCKKLHVKLHSKMDALKMLYKHLGLGVVNDLNLAMTVVRRFGYEIKDTYSEKPPADDDVMELEGHVPRSEETGLE